MSFPEPPGAKPPGTASRVQVVVGIALCVLLGLTVIVGGLLVVLGSDEDGPSPVASDPAASPTPSAQSGGTGVGSEQGLPEQKIRDVEKAAAAAGCELRTDLEDEGNDHEERTDFSAADYQTNPPTSGVHFPEWYQDGIYAPGDTPNLGMLVHTLEHGRINIQYAPGTPDTTVDQLEDLFNETEGYHLVVYENATEMPYAIAATAWRQMLGCPTVKPEIFDALRTFRDEFVDKGLEFIP